MSIPTVVVTQSGRGGSIHYHEGDHVVTFGWEFAMEPAIALIFGTGAAHWNAHHPWAAGRQAEIFDVVGDEVVRQQVPRGDHEADLDAGVLTILRERVGTRRADDPRARAAAARRAAAEAALAARRAEESVPWFGLDALVDDPSPDAERRLREALVDHGSIETRLVAADVLHRRDPSFDLEPVLTRQLRLLSRPADGLERALRMAEAHDSPTVRQALLWASWNATRCAPPCAALLLRLTGVDPASPDGAATLAGLGLHVNHFTRTDAFARLCAAVGMELDTTQGD